MSAIEKLLRCRWATIAWKDPEAESATTLPKGTIVIAINKIKTDDNIIMINVLTPAGIFCCFKQSFESL